MQRQRCGAPVTSTLAIGIAVRVLIALIALLASEATAAPPASFDDAWRYISAQGRSERWLIVSSKRSRNEYFECENLDDVVRCVVPVWLKIIPQSGRYLPVGGKETPYPDVEGSRLKEILDKSKVAKAREVLTAHGLVPSVIYSQVKNEQMKVVGTQCDLRVVLPLSHPRFELLVKTYLKSVFGVSESDGYVFETDG